MPPGRLRELDRQVASHIRVEKGRTQRPVWLELWRNHETVIIRRRWDVILLRPRSCRRLRVNLQPIILVRQIIDLLLELNRLGLAPRPEIRERCLSIPKLRPQLFVFLGQILRAPRVGTRLRQPPIPIL